MLTFSHVSFQYDSEDFNIIDDLSFSVGTGEFVSLIGISGCGKSTIFKLIDGILPLKAGQITTGGVDPTQCVTPAAADKKPSADTGGKPSAAADRKPSADADSHPSATADKRPSADADGRRSIDAGYMPQKDLLFPWRTIEKNVCLPMELRGIDPAMQKMRAAEVLEEVGLADYADKYPKDLSGGMRQRVSFARTLLTDAPLLLLDEPFSALDALTRMSMQEWLLSEWSLHEKTVLFITHDVEEAIFMSGKILLVEETPIRTLRAIDVPLPYPRRREYMARPEIISLRDDLVDMLRKQVKL